MSSSAFCTGYPLIAGLIAAALTSTAVAVERTDVDATRYPRIVNGVLTHDYPAVGAVLRGDFPDWAQHMPITADTASQFCSGTLIGCRTFLTAGHCTTTAFPAGTLEADDRAGGGNERVWIVEVDRQRRDAAPRRR